MARYFLDCEFIEDGHTIDLISIGIVCDDGHEYYAISTEFNPRKASQWVKDNVLSQLPPKPSAIHNPWISPTDREASKAWKSRKEIAHEVEEFLLGTDERPSIDGYLGKSPEIWGDYCGFDFVAFSQLMSSHKKRKTHNPMVDAYPANLPYYFHDVRQEWDRIGQHQLPKQENGIHNALTDARHIKTVWEFLTDYDRTSDVSR